MIVTVAGEAIHVVVAEGIVALVKQLSMFRSGLVAFVMGSIVADDLELSVDVVASEGSVAVLVINCSS